MENQESSNRSTDYREGRRFRAVELWKQGWKQRRVAEALGVTEAAVSQWLTRYRNEGPESLRQHKSAGPTPRLSEDQKKQLDELLRRGAESFGFTGALWTCDRVGEVIYRHFGVSYHRAHISKILHRMHWSRQKPVQRATQRDESAIKEWREKEWPRLKRGH